jgi:hypothetical protein
MSSSTWPIMRHLLDDDFRACVPDVDLDSSGVRQSPDRNKAEPAALVGDTFPGLVIGKAS